LATRWITTASGERVRVVEGGPADGDTVVFLHGWACSVYAFNRNLVPLARAGLRVIAFDLRGHGLSDKTVIASAYDLPSMAVHVREVLDALGIERTAVVAHSMGGAIAMQLAIMQPERVCALALLASVGFGTVDLLSLGRWLTPNVVTPAISRATRVVPRAAIALGLGFAWGSIGAPSQRDVDEYWAPTQFPEFVHALRHLLHAFRWDHGSESELRQLVMPTLVVSGTRDRIVRGGRVAAERLARHIPRSTLHVVQGAGHVLPEEAAAEVNEQLLAFLRETSRSS
jgi:pimeloyl-ACP methyl ester carboxylesterase